MNKPPEKQQILTFLGAGSGFARGFISGGATFRARGRSWRPDITWNSEANFEGRLRQKLDQVAVNEPVIPKIKALWPQLVHNAPCASRRFDFKQ